MTRVRSFLSLAVLAIVEPLAAQHGGFIVGVVRDRSGGTVPGAEIRVQNDATGARQKAYCDVDGKYFTSELVQGAYKITVRNEGFRTITQSGVAVKTGETRLVDFVIDVLPLQQEVTVEADRNDQDPTANGLTVSRQSSANSLPANGRDLHALISIMPGATITPASIGDGGQFTVAGQRPNTNSFRIDGVSGNAGIGVISIPGSFPGATLPGMTTIGSTQTLASKEETQRVELRSSDFVAESGDRPGAQIAIETRSGSNEFHGSAFGYFRPHFLNAQDWFSQSTAAGLPSAFLNGWGGSFGGPIWRNHTFFFMSFERADVHDSATQLIPVPSAEARSTAGGAYQAFLNTFRFPTSRTLNSTESLGISGLQKNGTISNQSFRLDQALGSKVQFFARYSDVPSSSTTFELGTANAKFRWLSTTAGFNISSLNVTQQIRFNYSQAEAVSMHDAGFDSDLPAVDLINRALSNYFFSNVDATLPPFLYGWQVTELSIAGVGQAISGQSGLTCMFHEHALIQLPAAEDHLDV
jgi:Carboxypeptidase regulatory-like domain